MHHIIKRKHSFGFFIERLAHFLARLRMGSKVANVLGQLVHVLRMEEQTVHAVVDQVGDSADVGGDRRAGHPRALRQRVGEGFGERGQQVDVQRVIKLVDLPNPPGKADSSGGAEFSGQRLHFRLLRAVAGDDQPDVWMCPECGGKSAQQRGHILQR